MLEEQPHASWMEPITSSRVSPDLQEMAQNCGAFGKRLDGEGEVLVGVAL